MQIVGIDHVVIRCFDAAQMLDFYCGVLGCTLERCREEIGLFQLRAGRSLIDLVSFSGELGREGGGPPAQNGRNMDHVCLRIDAFDEGALRGHFKAHGIELGEVQNNYGAEGEGPSFYLKDPEGNTVELKGPAVANEIPIEKIRLSKVTSREPELTRQRGSKKTMEEPKHSPPPVQHLAESLAQKVVGQHKAVEKIVPCIQMYQAGLSPVGRPAGVFLLLGPTGTGKTRTVEALAEVLHGDGRKVVRVDCGEYQSDHEVAKLIGSPPGYLGHRETPPILTTERLGQATSERCELALILFDEIEKAAPAVARLLLGILDKAILRLGDNTEVDFEKTVIFFTSNLGAHEMMKELKPGLGFRSGLPPNWGEVAQKLEHIALTSVRKMYSPEFVNRIDAVVTYQPLDERAMKTILDQQLTGLQDHVNNRLGDKRFGIDIPEQTRRFLLERGTSVEYGARELKRTIYRYLTQPLSTLVIESKIEPGSRVLVTVEDDCEKLRFTTLETKEARTMHRRRTLLIVDDNSDFLRLLSLYVESASSWRLITAQSVAEAGTLAAGQEIDCALLDMALPDGNGLKVGQQLKGRNANIQVIIMTGGALTLDEDQTCRREDFQVIYKPFLASDVVSLIEGRKRGVASA
jgi:DNA-binding NtrC family response regulator/catechol 2,3-dioxygenase-like lactoylglutathione lyase family enzyme